MKKFFAAALAAAMTFSLAGCGSKDKEETPVPLDESITKPISLYFEGYNEEDPQLVMDAVFPKICVELMQGNGMYEEQMDIITQTIEATHKMWLANYGRNCTVSATSDIVGSHMNDHELFCAANYFQAGYDEKLDVDVVEGYKVEFDFAVKGDADKLEGVQGACIVRLKDDEWKLVMDNVDTLVANYSGADVTFANGEN